jgi:phosphoribosylglycinamide formyltransferase-1
MYKDQMIGGAGVCSPQLSSGDRLRIAVLASGEGTTLQALIDAANNPDYPAQIVLVVSNKSESGALRRGRAAGVAAVYLSAITHPVPEQLDAALRGLLIEHRVGLVVLAGYLRKIGALTLQRFCGRIINTHPALLPRHGGGGMYGRAVHEAVVRSGDAESGASVHLVDADYDTGRVLAQVRVPVLPGMEAAALETQVQRAEKELLIDVVRRVAQGEINLSSMG